jgi:hypothetical protein
VVGFICLARLLAEVQNLGCWGQLFSASTSFEARIYVGWRSAQKLGDYCVACVARVVQVKAALGVSKGKQATCLLMQWRCFLSFCLFLLCPPNVFAFSALACFVFQSAVHPVVLLSFSFFSSRSQPEFCPLASLC